ncbi:hypothetical protein SXCC_04741 [Gluconacetobacter sp. SXCC-1]|nr:hypothetical protein SXCC_04741 [Gluconacetobacter sp. SXCC-1]
MLARRRAQEPVQRFGYDRLPRVEKTLHYRAVSLAGPWLAMMPA